MFRTSQMAKWVKTLAAKPVDVSLIPKIKLSGKRPSSHQLSSDSHLCGVVVHPALHTNNEIKINSQQKKNFYKKNYFLFSCVYMCMVGSVQAPKESRKGHWNPRTESQTMVRQATWVLETTFRFSLRAVNTQLLSHFCSFPKSCL